MSKLAPPMYFMRDCSPGSSILEFWFRIEHTLATVITFQHFNEDVVGFGKYSIHLETFEPTKILEYTKGCEPVTAQQFEEKFLAAITTSGTVLNGSVLGSVTDLPGEAPMEP